MAGQQHDLVVYPDAEALTRGAAERIVELARDAVDARGRFTIALSGGNTPRALYRLLATPSFAPRIDWERVEVFFSDERCVPVDDDRSNLRMATDALLAHVPIPAEQVHRIHGEEEDPEDAADDYEEDLADVFDLEPPGDEPGSDTPRFDLILLGLGENGHTASLFPHTGAVFEDVRWVAAYNVQEAGMWRVTMTPVVLNAALNVVFLVTGREKAPVLRPVLHGEYDPDPLPAQIVRPIDGNLTWMVDEVAAAALP
ncbi:MAG: 6-phosphogluconolactonase [Actinomycetota bacterium]